MIPVLGWVALSAIFLLLLETRREVREIGEQMYSLHRDFISEVAQQYGEYNGEE
jgi:hypothetical protein